MKKLLLLLVVIPLSLTKLIAQDATFVKGDKVLNLGLGIGSTIYTGTYFKSQVPPISVSYEAGIVDNVLEKGVIGVGGYIGYSSYKSDYGSYGWKYSNLLLGVRGNFHYPLVNKLDTYTGLLLGYNIASDKAWGTYTYDYSASYGGIRAAWFVGGRYYFNDSFAVMAELGYGITYLNLGVSLKF